MKFPRSIDVPVGNHLTGRVHRLVRASDLDGGPETLARIAEICNEPEIYDWLFRDAAGSRAGWGGRPYAVEDARQFLIWARDGWTAGTHFVFVVVDEKNRVAAACDIKTNDAVAELGYWASRQSRGVMTNAVKAVGALAAGAGFQGLYARTKPGNVKSQAVLRRAGFIPVPVGPDGYHRFELLLRSSG